MTEGEGEPVIQIFLFLGVLEVQNRVSDQWYNFDVFSFLMGLLDGEVLLLEQVVIDADGVVVGLDDLN